MKNENLVPYEGTKGKTSGSGTRLCERLETDDLTAILDLTINASTARMGRPAEYPNTQKGLDDFIQKTIDYFSYVNSVNANPDLERKLIPDIENWAVYMGVTRMTINNYERRGRDWRDCIGYYKNAIGAVKKQLAMNYKIPPMVYVFDATNNHGYVNSNEFKLTETRAENEAQSVDDDIRTAGLVWNDALKKLEPMEGWKNE